MYGLIAKMIEASGQRDALVPILLEGAGRHGQPLIASFGSRIVTAPVGGIGLPPATDAKRDARLATGTR